MSTLSEKGWARVMRFGADPENPTEKFINDKQVAWVTYKTGNWFLVNIEGSISMDIECDQDLAQYLGEATGWEGALRQVVDALGL